MGVTSCKILACWRCRGAKLLPLDERNYRCPACEMPVSEEDVLGAWRSVEEGEARLLTADTWDEFLRIHQLDGDGQVLLGKSCGRSFRWGFVPLREVRTYVDQGQRISWLPKPGPGGMDGEIGNRS